MSVCSRNRNGNTGVYDEPRSTKSNAAGQLERREGSATNHVREPASKHPQVKFYEPKEQDKLSQSVTSTVSTSYERIFQAGDSVVAFGPSFTHGYSECIYHHRCLKAQNLVTEQQS